MIQFKTSTFEKEYEQENNNIANVYIELNYKHVHERYGNHVTDLEITYATCDEVEIDTESKLATKALNDFLYKGDF